MGGAEAGRDMGLFSLRPQGPLIPRRTYIYDKRAERKEMAKERLHRSNNYFTRFPKKKTTISPAKKLISVKDYALVVRKREDRS